MDFVQVPRSLIMEKSISDKRVLVYLAITFSKWNGERIGELTAMCGYSPLNRHQGSAGQQVKEVVNHLTDKTYLSIRDASVQLAPCRECFGVIRHEEYRRIMNMGNSMASGLRVNHAHMLLTLSTIRCHMSHLRSTPQIYSDLLKRISEHIGISVRNISSCIRALEDLEIIHSEELPRYRDRDGHWHSNVRIFVNRQSLWDTVRTYDWQKETKRGINMILANQLC